MTKRTPSAQVRGAVLSAAVTLLDTVGSDGFTVRAIAERADVAPMAIYNHFDGINGVIEQICVDAFSLLTEYFDIDTGHPLEDFIASGLAYRRFAREHPGYYLAIFLHNFTDFVGTDRIATVAHQSLQALTAMVERAQAAGVIRSGDPESIANILWSTCHGFVALEAKGASVLWPDPDALYIEMMTTVRAGLQL